MIFRLALKELKRNHVINILCFFQITLIFVVTSAVLTTVLNKYERYKPFKNILDEKGVYVDVLSLEFEDNELIYPAYDESNLTEKLGLKNVDSIYCMKNLWIDQDVNTCVLSDEYIEMYEPELKNGKWLTESENLPDDVIPVVISENDDNINVGDIFEITSPFGIKARIKAYVTGVLSDNTSVIYTASESNIHASYEDMFVPYNHDFEEKTLIIIKNSDLEKHCPDITRNLYGPMIITYNESITDDEINENFDKLMLNGEFKIYSTLENMNKNSKEIVFEDFFKLLPMIIAVLLLVIISIISVSAVNTKTRIKTYAVYFLCGMQWKHIRFIEALKSSIIVTSSAILSMLICITANNRSIFGGLLIGVGFWQIVSWICIGMIFIMTATLLPGIIIKKQKPVSVFHSQ